MIPKVIHYCWFGGKPIPKLEKKCIKSWKKYCKDYEIIRWDESNFDVNAHQFTKEAYEAKKWAFVADFARLSILTKYGGIYLDTDIELLRPIDDLLNYKAFTGFENDKLVAAGIMGCEKNNSSFYLFFDRYTNNAFKKPDGSANITSIPVILTNLCSTLGFDINNKYQEIDGFAIFPSEYFYPKDYGTGLTNITCNTYSIHHYSASWFNSKEKKQLKKRWKKNKLRNFLISIFGTKLFYFFRKRKNK